LILPNPGQSGKSEGLRAAWLYDIAQCMNYEIKLTQTVQKGGCAAKLAASDLRKILGQLRFPPAPPELLVDGGLFDDAAIYRITPDIALVQTLDFFTPIVDTPKLFGAIAAANALSDVYAMGGRPETCMAILAFPSQTLPENVAVDVLQGACDIIAEAKAVLAGGHSIDDDTLKFGLSVTGRVHPDRIWSNNKARPGDILILTKPLGTGALTAALKRQEANESDIDSALYSMTRLNNVIDILSPHSAGAIHSATDITGFGLSGHSTQMAQASQVSLEFEWEALPKFAQTMHYLEKGFLTKAHRGNSQYTQEKIDTGELSELQKLLLHDPQTSGGLLLSVAPDLASQVLSQIREHFPFAQAVGTVREKLSKDCLFK
jgi:selenide,water dikinase